MPHEELLGGRLGEVAALGTAACWSVTPLFFAAAGRRIGAFSVNVIRLVAAVALLGAALLVAGPDPDVPLRQVALFGLSGAVGLALGDLALFRALVLIGPRRATLVMALAPVFVAALSVPLVGERLGLQALCGMAITLAGVAWVVAERLPAEAAAPGSRAGTALAVAAAAGQGVGLLLAKAGLGEARPGSWLSEVAGGAAAAHVTPLQGTFLRMTTGAALVLLAAAASGRLGRLGSALRDRRAVSLSLGGAVFGPFVGVWLSLVAVRQTEAAVAQTLMSVSPVLVIPLTRLVHGERAGVRGWFGAVVAVAGVAVLSARGGGPE